MNEELRQCLNCKKSFPLTRQFYGQKTNGNFRARCRDCDKEAQKKYAANNPVSIQEKWMRQNERRKLAGSRWTADDEVLIREKLKDKCLYCEIELFGGGEVDHMTSLESGGTNEFLNLTLACRQCNRAKGEKSAADYIQWRLSRGLHCRDFLLSTQESAPDVLAALKNLLDVIDKRPAVKLANGEVIRKLRKQYDRLKE